MLPSVVILQAAAGTSVAGPGQNWVVPAAVAAALIAALASVAVAVFNFFAGRRERAVVRELDQLAKERERADERARALRADYVRPFFTDLVRNSVLSRDVNLHVLNLRPYPLSPAFKRRLLANSNVIATWGDSGVALNNHTAELFLAIDMKSANEFTIALDGLIRSQMGIVQDLWGSFEFNDAGFAELEKRFAEHRSQAAKLWILSRKIIVHSAQIDDSQGDWSVEGLGASLAGVTSRLNYTFRRSVSSWSVWWRIPKSGDWETLHQSFCSKRDELAAVLADVPGVIGVETENEANEKESHSVLTVRFSSESALTKFCDELLPGLKVQTKSLWEDAINPYELTG